MALAEVIIANEATLRGEGRLPSRVEIAARMITMDSEQVVAHYADQSRDNFIQLKVQERICEMTDAANRLANERGNK